MTHRVLALLALASASAFAVAPTATGWFRYGPVDPGACDDTYACAIASNMGGAAFGELPPEGIALGDSEAEQPLAHLMPSVEGTFYFCAVAETAGGTAFGEVQTFTVEGAAASELSGEKQRWGAWGFRVRCGARNRQAPRRGGGRSRDEVSGAPLDRRNHVITFSGQSGTRRLSGLRFLARHGSLQMSHGP